MEKANYIIEDYDKEDPKSIENMAKGLIGKTFRNVLENDYTSILSETNYGERKRKGGVGNLLEEHYFHIGINSESRPDFVEAGVELKVSPYEYNKMGETKAGERLVLSMISNNEPVEDVFEKSHFWNKCKLILLIYYLRNRELHNNLDYRIDYAMLFTPPKEDLEIIKQDYYKIIEKIKAGKAHEISESDTLYLGACTKGATAESSLQKQYYSEVPAKRRAFCYKNSYMTYVLNNYIKPGKETYESIVSAKDLVDFSFEELIENKINCNIGKSDKQLCKEFGREYNNNKAQWNDLVFRMLGIKSNRAEEFDKANITVRTIRLEEDGCMRESMSLSPFKYKELIVEEWEDSKLHNYFDETKFLFVVFKKENDEYILKGCQFWNMPCSDLEYTVKDGWNKVQQTIKEGVKLDVVRNGDSVIVKNNFPSKADNEIVHIRPHASKRYFQFTDGTIIGDGNKSNANQLPDGTWMPNYSFWLNNSYIEKQLKYSLK